MLINLLHKRIKLPTVESQPKEAECRSKPCISGPLLGETTPSGSLPSSGTLPSVSSSKLGETSNMHGEQTFALNSATRLAPRSVHFNDFLEDCEFLLWFPVVWVPPRSPPSKMVIMIPVRRLLP